MMFTTFPGGTTADRFLTYLKETLVPTLRPGDIVVMDNLKTHHIQAVGELPHAAGVDVLYLPPYSSDLNQYDGFGIFFGIEKQRRIRCLSLIIQSLMQHNTHIRCR